MNQNLPSYLKMKFEHTVAVIMVILLGACNQERQVSDTEQARPNILLAMSDNQSYPHTGIYGDQSVNTPAFDYIARQGILFHNAFVNSPGCAPARSSILTGRYFWQNEEAGGHQTLFPEKYVPFTDVLEASGYHIGFTGKGCAPFNWMQGGRTRDPAGPAYNEIRYGDAAPVQVSDEVQTDPEAFSSDISTIDYAANFEAFLEDNTGDQPFFFWYGAREPHRPFEPDIGLKSGKSLSSVEVPGFLPDHEAIRKDMLDYAYEIDWFDQHLMSMIETLREQGQLENTLIIVTSDNGMQFPRSIGNSYEYGLHVPLAISWPAKIKGGRVSEDLIDLTALAPTILEITGTDPGQMMPIAEKSLTNIFFSDQSGIIDPSRQTVYSGRERHSSARWMNLGYPQRAIRTREFLYIRNYYPERWPAGAPQLLDPDNPDELAYMHGLDENGKYTGQAYTDIDDSPSKTYLIENKDDPEVSKYFQLSVGKRPAEELFDIAKDPACINNLVDDETYQSALVSLRGRLSDFLKETEDPRVFGPNPDIFENYQRFYVVRPFPRPDWVEAGE